MKAVCPSCERLIDVTAVRVLGGTAFVGCPKCGVESSLQVTTGELPTLTEVPKAAPPMPLSSRKTPGPRAIVFASSAEASNVVMLRAPTAAAIDSARQMAEADPFAVPAGLCPKCLSKRDDVAVSCGTCGLVFANASVEFMPPPDLAAMWKDLLRDWGDEPRHAALRRLAQERGQLPDLARLYRLRLAVMPEDPLAQRGRDDVLSMSSALLLQREPGAAEGGVSTGLKLVVGAVALVVILAAASLMVKLLSGLP